MIMWKIIIVKLLGEMVPYIVSSLAGSRFKLCSFSFLGGSFKAHIRCLTMAATVYHVWEERNWSIFRYESHDWNWVLQERNWSIFRYESHDWNWVLQRIEESIRHAMWDWKAQRNYQNWEACIWMKIKCFYNVVLGYVCLDLVGLVWYSGVLSLLMI